MNLAFEQSLLGFDLDLLHEPGNNDVNCLITDNHGSTLQQTTTDASLSQHEISQPHKKSSVRKGISYLKKKIIDTGTLVQQYNARCDQVAKLENNIVTLNNKCREACIEREQHRQNSECLEKECEELRKRNLALEQSLLESDQLKAASEAHSHQLEQLVKDQDTRIEIFKHEKLQTKETIKDLEKRLNVLERYKENFITELCTFADIVVTKRALSKAEQISLSKYTKLKRKRDAGKKNKKKDHTKDNADSDTDNCEDLTLSDTEEFTKLNNEKVFSPPLCPTKQYASMIKKDSRKDDIDSESVDGGRGSSLALSDSDTVYSPEYYLNSPVSQINVENHKNKGAKLADSDISPISKKQPVDRATSPIIELVQPPKTATAKPKTIDKALSPFRYADIVAANVDGIEPIIPETTNVELTSSDTLLNDNMSDCEVEMILKSMQLNAALVTPIPPTPSRSISTRSRTVNEHLTESPQAKRSEDPEFQALVKTVNSMNKQLEKLLKRTVGKKEASLYSEGDELNRVNKQDTSPVLETIFENVTEDDSSIQECVQNTTSTPHNKEVNKALSEQEPDSALGCYNKKLKNASKIKKLTPLQKFKKNLMPKSKIRPDSPPSRALRSRINPNTITKNINTIISDSAVTFNNNVNEKDVVSIENSVKCQLKPITPSTREDMYLAEMKSQHNIVIPAKAQGQSVEKLRNDLSSTRTLRSRTDSLSTNKSNTVQSESSATLNNKEVYENAVRVMAELNSQQKSISPRITNRRVQKSGANILKQKENTKISKNNDSTTEHNVSTELMNVEENNFDQHNNNEVSLPGTTDINNMADDAVKTKSENTSNNVVNSAVRRKSMTPEIDSILSKSRKKYPSLSLDKDIIVVLTRSSVDMISKPLETNINIENYEEVVKENKPLKGNKPCDDIKLEAAQNERKLRSTARRSEASENIYESEMCNKKSKPVKYIRSQSNTGSNDQLSEPVSYNDLNIFNDLEGFDDQPMHKKYKSQNTAINTIQNLERSILCRFINKFGSARHNATKKVPESIAKSLSTKLTEYIARAIEPDTPTEAKPILNEIIEEVQKWKFEEFLAGVMHYLLDPTRKLELFNQINNPSTPRMTRSEQVLLVVVTRCTWNNNNTINTILSEIEYTLFRLNQTPEMKVVESMAHFYAVICRYIGGKNRLRRFMADALYCMNYSAVALIKQCLEVWMLVLPLAHMGEAKQPLVISIVYVLHFFKCEDKTNKVQDIRNILKHKYFYNVTDWDETKMLESLYNAILELSDDPLEIHNLRMALYLIAKRNGPNFCQTKLIKGLLMPIIVNDKTPEKVKAFCVSTLGKLYRPYPEGMKVHCEIALNQLLDMLDKNPSPPMTEAIFNSLIAMSRHNQNRVIKALLHWQPKEVSPEMEQLLTVYVQEKSEKAWSSILSKMSLE